MAIRLYWTNAAADATPPAWRNPNWDKTAGAVIRSLGAKAGSITTVAMAETSTSSTYDMPHGAWVSDPFLRDATIDASETIAVTMGRNANAASSFYSMLYVYVMAPDGSVRAVVCNRIGSSYWGTSAANGGWNAFAIGADVTVQAGDRLVVEPGVRAANTTSTSRTATMYYGGTGTDFPITAGDTNVNSKVGWIELSGAGFESLWTAPPVQAPTVNAGADTAVSANVEFTRTATEGGGAPTSRSWTIVSGPAGVGSTLSTAAALSWTPTVAGAYVLRYTASNAGGSASDDVTVTVIADYYISAAGSDSNPGTAAAPWQTFGPSYSVTFGAGNTINLRGGDTFSGLLYLAQGGAAGNTIKVRSYGTGRATITNTTNSAIYVYNAGYVEIDNVNVVGGAGAWAYDGIAFYASGAGQKPYARISNCDLSWFRNGIALGGDTGGGWSDVVITNVDAHDCRDQGIFTYGPSATRANANVSVIGCRAWSNPGDASNTTTHTGSGILLGSVDGGLIQSCAAWGNGASCTASEGPVGIWCYDSNAVVIELCLAYSNRTGGTADGDGFDLDIRTTNSEIRYCLAYGNDGAGILVYGGAQTAHSGNKVHHNLTWGNCRKADFYYAELTVAGNVGDVAIFHNTLIAQDSGTVHPPVVSIEDTGAAGASIRNNLLRGASGYRVRAENAYAATAIVLQGNAYEGGAGYVWGASAFASLAALRAGATGQEAVSGAPVGWEGRIGLVAPDTAPTVTAASALGSVPGLQLGPYSPARARGLDLPTLFGTALGTRDYFGGPLAAPYAVGAHEQANTPGPEPGRRLLAA